MKHGLNFAKLDDESNNIKISINKSAQNNLIGANKTWNIQPQLRPISIKVEWNIKYVHINDLIQLVCCCLMRDIGTISSFVVYPCMSATTNLSREHSWQSFVSTVPSFPHWQMYFHNIDDPKHLIKFIFGQNWSATKTAMTTIYIAIDILVQNMIVRNIQYYR